jgi:hypothetical protein
LKDDEILEAKHARKFLFSKQQEVAKGAELEEMLALIRPFIVEYVSRITGPEK